MKQVILLLSVLVLGGLTPLKAQVTFEAKLSKNRLGLNERLRVSFEMNQNGDNFRPPNFDGFTVVGGPNQSVSNSWFNGKRTFSKSYTYFITPNRKGALTIGQASIEIEGEIYKTSPKTVEVTSAVNKPNSPQARANAVADENLHLVAEISKGNPYLNEAITVVYKLYFSSEISVSNVNELERPKYTDFWSHLIPIPKLEIKRGTFNGQPYNYVVWRKAVLYPQKTGKLILEPLTLNVSVDVPTNRRDFFGNRVYQKTPKVITAGRRTVSVRSLPEKNRPEGFTGAVGDFDLNVKFNKTALKASESFQLAVKVSGRGNLKLFSLPELNAPSSLEVYEPEHRENIKTNLLGMQGNIEDVYTVVPQFQGNYPIPPVLFSYFDPIQEKYVTLKSKETLVDVYEGPTASRSPQNGSVQNKISAPNDTYFDFIKLETAMTVINTEPYYRSAQFWLFLLAPFGLYLLYALVLYRQDHHRVDPVSERQKQANRLAKKYLSSAKKALGNKDNFYDALERALHNYLKAKLTIETSEFSKERIAKLLLERKTTSPTLSAFISILEKCEAARYSPITEVSMQEDFDLAVRTITTLDKEI
ncbi:MAG: BatD family protein [Flavobacteriaceae bacterium]